MLIEPRDLLPPEPLDVQELPRHGNKYLSIFWAIQGNPYSIAREMDRMDRGARVAVDAGRLFFFDLNRYRSLAIDYRWH